MEIQEYVDIKDYSTFKIGGQFRYFIKVNNLKELEDALDFAKKENVPFFILGSGSNLIFSDGVINILAIKINIKGFEVVKETDEYTDIKVGAGEVWDDVVKRTVEMNMSGFEAMSIIPGTVGAGPVQNVGAYGVEIKDVLLEVEVFDIKDNTVKILSNKDCNFGYRDSIFKGEEKGRYIILYVVYRLFKKELQIPNYPDVLKYFTDKNILKPSILDIRNAIIEIRNSKLPNPKDTPNVGSFFKNPIIPNNIAKEISEKFVDARLFPIDDKYTKIGAGWLIEKSGLKGKSFGNISIYDKNALVLVNNGNATVSDLIKAKNEIIKIVYDKFNVNLEQEPDII